MTSDLQKSCKDNIEFPYTLPPVPSNNICQNEETNIGPLLLTKLPPLFSFHQFFYYCPFSVSDSNCKENAGGLSSAPAWGLPTPSPTPVEGFRLSPLGSPLGAT